MSKKQLTFFYITIITLARIIPHPANCTPLTNLSLFAGKQLNKIAAVATTLIAIFISDIALAYLYGYPLIGYWTLFSYSGFAAIVLCGTRITNKPSILNLLIYVLASCLGYWVWTNFGAWLLTPAYAKTAAGLLQCYAAAIPFLRNALLGDLTWMVVIFGSYQWVQNRLAVIQQLK